jgi:hypothetical protein
VSCSSPTLPPAASTSRNRFPQAPPSELLYRILEILFSPREAELVARLPIKPFSLAAAARAWKVSPSEARKTLDGLASRAIPAACASARAPATRCA